MPVKSFENVEGEFPCPNCDGTILTGTNTCNRCGGTLGKASQKSVPSAVKQSARRVEESREERVTCEHCQAQHSKQDIKDNNGKCPNCGADLEEKKKYSAPQPQSASPVSVPVSTYTSARFSRPAASQKNPFWYYLVGGAIAILVIFGIIGLVKVIQKKSERHDAVGYVTGSSWSTEIKTLMPYARENESRQPVSGEGITPMPMYTAVVDNIPNPLPTYVTTEIVPGPTSMVDGPDRPCTEAEIAEFTERKADDSFKVPKVCYDEIAVAGEDIILTEVHTPMGTPTPVYGEIYPYIETGFEPGTPLTESGSGSEYFCSSLDKLPAGWRANPDDCLVSFSLTVMVGDNEDTKIFPVNEDVYMANLSNRNLRVIVDGYGDIVEVAWP